jgi:hypothetical protein
LGKKKIIALLSLGFFATQVDTAAGANNEYVNVSSSTPGVSNVIAIDDTDFHITTSDVEDNFEAEVTVAGRSPWTVVPEDPQTSTIGFGGAGYSVENTVDEEQEAAGNIIMFKVDVEIGGVGESEEMTKGAFVPYVMCNNGQLTDECIAAMTSVSIRCMPGEREGDSINIEFPQGHLYEKVGGSYQPAQSSYLASEINGKEFAIHGHDVSGAIRDFSITAKHSANGCEDTATYTVYSVSADGSEIELMRESSIQIPLVVSPGGIEEFLHFSDLGVSVSGFDDIHWTAYVIKEGSVFAIRVTNLIPASSEEAWADDHQWLGISGVTLTGQAGIFAMAMSSGWKNSSISVWFMKKLDSISPLLEKAKKSAANQIGKEAESRLQEHFEDNPTLIVDDSIIYTPPKIFVNSLGKNVKSSVRTGFIEGSLENIDMSEIDVRDSFWPDIYFLNIVNLDSIKIKFGVALTDEDKLKWIKRVSLDVDDLSSHDFFLFDKNTIEARVVKTGRIATLDWKASASASVSFYNGEDPDEGKIETKYFLLFIRRF